MGEEVEVKKKGEEEVLSGLHIVRAARGIRSAPNPLVLVEKVLLHLFSISFFSSYFSSLFRIKGATRMEALQGQAVTTIADFFESSLDLCHESHM